MSVMSATVLLFMFFPIATISEASSTASSIFSMNAPLPVLTSRTIASVPEASFLLIMLEAMSGMLFTVPLTSRSAYILLSAGSRSAD